MNSDVRPPDADPPLTQPLPSESQAAQLVAVLDAYLADLKVGQAPDRAELIAQHPELAAQLEACLAGVDFLHRAQSDNYNAPQTLGDFRLLREIGRGGMGAVYEAEQVSLGRRVALKILRFGTVADREAVDRFRREAETVANLHHTNIVPIFSVGQEQGVNFYAMQFIEGCSLDQVLQREGRQSAARVVEWGLQAAEALSHAHQRGVIHRDVKPSNLLLDHDRRIWLTDFGLAKRLDDVTISLTGALLGTPRYMSPEQARAATTDVDRRTDIYSLGATLYELVTGVPTFQADTPHGVIQQILTTEPVPPRKHQPDLPRDLDTVLLKCLAKHPAQRYGSAKELADDLRAVQDGRPISARRTTWLEHGVRWVRKQKRSVALTIGSVAATLMIIFVSLLVGQAYARWRSAYLTLDSDTPPLVAEIWNRNGQPLADAVTVPTQQPVELPAGDVQFRISGPSQLSETRHAFLPRGNRLKFDLKLDNAPMSPPIATTRGFRAVRFTDGTDLVLFDDRGISRHDMSTGDLLWSEPLAESDPPLLRDSGLVWPWSRALWMSERREEKFDLRPWAAATAKDLDGDGHEDLVLAAQHQAWLLAVSGTDGHPLWLAARGADVGQPNAIAASTSPQVRSAILSAPQWVDDFDGDGVPELLVTWADAGSAPRWTSEVVEAERWVELMSGGTGETCWRTRLQEDWFQLPEGEEVPYASRWFVGYSSGSSASSGSRFWVSPAGLTFRSIDRLVERTGTHGYAPSVPRVISLHAASELPEDQADAAQTAGAERKVVALVAGRFVVALDLQTGSPWIPPMDLAMHPDLPPTWADTNADGVPELICVEDRPPKSVPPRQFAQVRVSVTSLNEQRRLWQRDVTARFPRRPDWSIPAPCWPLLEDLDGDGACELILPDGTSDDGLWFARATPWGELAVLDGRTGERRWTCRLRTMDQQVDHFCVGPDLDQDGVRDLFAASLWGSKCDLFLDAISGSDGRRLRWNQQPVRQTTQDSDEFVLGAIGLWNRGPDGWPQVAISVHPLMPSSDASALFLFSAGTGVMERFSRGVQLFWTDDVNADGGDDLCTISTTGSQDTVNVFTGVRELWQWYRTPTTTVTDLDQDGFRDLIQLTDASTIRAISGRDGQPRWRAALPRGFQTDGDRFIRALHSASSMEQRLNRSGEARATDWDFDQDGTPDLLLISRESPSQALQALSGKDGRRIWSVGLPVNQITQSLWLQCQDLDGDGRSEVIWVAGMDLGYGSRPSYSTADQQLWLSLLDGQTGKIRWQCPLTAAYGQSIGRPPMPYRLDYMQFECTQADLNADGTLDLILPAESTDAEGRSELRAVNGRNGKVLWRFGMPEIVNSNEIFREFMPAEIADLDGDGSLEVVILAVEDENPSGTQRQRSAQLIALEGRDGRERWRWSTSTSLDYAESDAMSRRYNGRPRPVILRSKEGSPKISLAIQNENHETIVIDHAGKLVGRLGERRGYDWPSFRSWVYDIDQDGHDELILIHENQLIAVRPEQMDKPIWRHPLIARCRSEVIGIVAGSSPAAAQIVLRDLFGNRSIRGVRATDGMLAWSCPAPAFTPSHSDDGRMDLDLLHADFATTPCWAFLTEDAAICRQANERRDSLSSPSRVPAVLAELDNSQADPRLLRDLPWNMRSDNPHLGSSLSFFVWATIRSILIVLVPGAILVRFVRFRKWGMGTLFLLPLATALLITGLTIPQSPDGLRAASERAWVALMVTPGILFFVGLCRAAVRQNWRRVVFWLVGSVLAASLIAAATLYGIHKNGVHVFSTGERYSWEGWYWIWFAGVYACGCLMLLEMAIRSPIAGLGARLFRRRTANV